MKPSSSAASATTLLELLEARAEQLRDQPLFTFVEDGEEERTVLSHAGLERRARGIGAAAGRGGGGGGGGGWGVAVSPGAGVGGGLLRLPGRGGGGRARLSAGSHPPGAHA